MTESREREGRQLFCRIITPERPVFDDEVDLVIAHIADGELGVLVDHAPTVSKVTRFPIGSSPVCVGALNAPPGVSLTSR